MTSSFNYALLVASVFALSICLTMAKGGNCKNECESAMGILEDCKKEECTQVCNTTSSSGNNVVGTENCVCPSGCQSCFDDLLGTDGGFFKKNKCRGCTDKNGYNFDKNVLPDLEKEAEAIGCTAGSSKSANFNFALIFISFFGICFVL